MKAAIFLDISTKNQQSLS